jgi:putative phosphoesterase
MKIAILSDIHGNDYALEAVLAEAKKEHVEKLLILGDIVGYYYNVDKVIDKLSHWDFDIIKGNHELILEGLINKTIDQSSIQLKYGSGHFIAIEKPSKNQLSWLINLPENKHIEINGCKILMCHGSPWSVNSYIYPNTPKTLIEMCDSEAADIVFIGHTHYPFFLKNNNSLLINCGSVGQARNKGGQANWCLLNTENGAIQLNSTNYDTSKLKSEILNIDPSNSYLIEILDRNTK